MDSTMLTLVPAYGRDYKSAAAAVTDWKANKDFLIADPQHPYDGKPINAGQHPGAVRIRYAGLRRVALVPPRQAG